MKRYDCGSYNRPYNRDPLCSLLLLCVCGWVGGDTQLSFVHVRRGSFLAFTLLFTFFLVLRKEPYLFHIICLKRYMPQK